MQRFAKAIFTSFLGIAFLGCSGDFEDDFSEGEESLVGTFHIRIKHSGKCVDIASGGNANGTNVQQWNCNGTGAQQFRAESINGGYRFINPQSGKCLDISGSSTANGGNLQLWNCNGTNAQTFRVQDVGGGFSRIVNVNSNRCLDVEGGWTHDNANIHQWDCHDGDNQKYSFVPVGGSSGGGGGGGSTCNYPNWAQGHWYDAGAIVRFTDGKFYRAKHANPGYDPTISTWYWEPFNCSGGSTGGGGGGGGSTGGGGGGSTGGTGFAAIVSEAQFNSWFPNRNSLYSYAGLIEATKKFPAFCATGDDTARKREAAMFLAHVKHESGSLVYTREINQNDSYCASDWGCQPCAPGQKYFGRGPLQLSWQGNYCAAGQALGLGDQLRTNPDTVATTPWIAWGSSLWFLMTQTGAGNRTMHDGILNSGFGETIRTLNGSLECNGRNPGSVNARISYYQDFCNKLGVSPGGNLGC